ncbi:MAG TPA: hypothetical protein VMA73_12570 [Streptosporangiaceae bacterium]|nr:hypothetical protein [Streptosporangiaceae bacterium]
MQLVAQGGLWDELTAAEALDVRPAGIEQADLVLLTPAGVLAQVQCVGVAGQPV